MPLLPELCRLGLRHRVSDKPPRRWRLDSRCDLDCPNPGRFRYGVRFLKDPLKDPPARHVVDCGVTKASQPLNDPAKEGRCREISPQVGDEFWDSRFRPVIVVAPGT